jgi:hypothetical protein
MQLDILENNVERGAVISLYRCGPMVDLCRGPHVPNSSYIKCLAITNASRAFWRGDTSKDGLQRVYGVSFPDKKQMAGVTLPRAHAGLGPTHVASLGWWTTATLPTSYDSSTLTLEGFPGQQTRSHAFFCNGRVFQDTQPFVR